MKQVVKQAIRPVAAAIVIGAIGASRGGAHP
jgi:hypothetical protein